jgi:hypothetical protein
MTTDIKKLKDLERDSIAFSGFMCDLVELETHPNLTIPTEFGTREAYREVLVSDIRIARGRIESAWQALNGFEDYADDSHVVDPNWLALDPNH